MEGEIFQVAVFVSMKRWLDVFRCFPKPSKGVKFQPPGLFLVVKGLKFHTLEGFRFGDCSCHSFRVRHKQEVSPGVADLCFPVRTRW